MTKKNSAQFLPARSFLGETKRKLFLVSNYLSSFYLFPTSIYSNLYGFQIETLVIVACAVPLSECGTVIH